MDTLLTNSVDPYATIESKIFINDNDEILLCGLNFDSDSYYLALLDLEGEVKHYEPSFLKYRFGCRFGPIHISQNDVVDYLVATNEDELYKSDSNLYGEFIKYIEGVSITNKFKKFSFIGENEDDLLFTDQNGLQALNRNSFEVKHTTIDTNGLNKKRLVSRSYLEDGS